MLPLLSTNVKTPSSSVSTFEVIGHLSLLEVNALSLRTKLVPAFAIC